MLFPDPPGPRRWQFCLVCGYRRDQDPWETWTFGLDGYAKTTLVPQKETTTGCGIFELITYSMATRPKQFDRRNTGISNIDPRNTGLCPDRQDSDRQQYRLWQQESHFQMNNESVKKILQNRTGTHRCAGAPRTRRLISIMYGPWARTRTISASAGPGTSFPPAVQSQEADRKRRRSRISKVRERWGR